MIYEPSVKGGSWSAERELIQREDRACGLPGVRQEIRKWDDPTVKAAALSQSLDEWEFVCCLGVDGERLLCAYDRSPGNWPCALLDWFSPSDEAPLCAPTHKPPRIRFVTFYGYFRQENISEKISVSRKEGQVSDVGSEKFFSTAAIKGIMEVPPCEWTFLCNGGELPRRAGGRLQEEGYDPFRAVVETGLIADDRDH
ncbi:hypothetical protein Q8A73_023625 [Channa argus]|nr:hypothetical protein Q8A73_023625 [Channa argus]